MSKKHQVMTAEDNFIMTDVKKKKVENIQQDFSSYEKDKNYLHCSKKKAETIYRNRTSQKCMLNIFFFFLFY